MKNQSIIKKIITASLTVMILLIFSSCSQSESDKVNYKTTLTFSPNFAGTRTFTVTYPTSSVSPSSDRAEKLDKLIQDSCPSALAHSLDKSSGSLSYTFTLSFSSFSDYMSKLTDILGTRPTVTFANPDTPLTQGWRIEESFQSSQLLHWLTDAAHAEQIYDYDIPSEESATSVNFNSETVSTTPTVSVNKLSGHPIKSIKISTVNKKSTFDRTFTFKISQNTFDSLGDKISKYFTSVTDSTASTTWQIENGEYTYTADFKNITLKQLEGYTNRLFSSVYGDTSYVDRNEGSTPLAYQNSFIETLDFSNYVSDNNTDVPIEYTYTTADNSELDSCLIYSNLEWINASDFTAENDPGRIVGISSKQPSLTVRINDGKQYKPQIIDITLTPLDNDNFKKSYAFSYNIEENGFEASGYTATYFEDLGISTTQTSKENTATCTIEFTGTPAEINSKITKIFGEGNLLTYSSDIPFMTLRTAKHIEDTIDLSPILIGENIDTPVNYTLASRNGEIAKSLIRTIKASDKDSNETVYADKNDNGSYSVLLAGSKAVLNSEVSVANVSDIIVFCAISVIIILLTIAAVLFLKSREVPHATLPEGNAAELAKKPNAEIKTSERKRKKRRDKD